MVALLLKDLRIFWKIAFFFVFFIVSINLFWSYIYYDTGIVRKIEVLIDVNGEANIPTFYSGLVIILNSILLYIIAKSSTKDKFYWYSLSFIFLYLACDEVAMLHEVLNGYFYMFGRANSYLFYDWVVPAIVVVFIVGLIMLRFVLRLPKKIKIGFIVSGCIFVGGAIGMEMIGADYHFNSGTDSFTFRLLPCLEEFMEMVGMLLFMKYLIIYLESILEVQD